MSNPYGMLTYPTADPIENIEPGKLLGHDEVGRYYEVSEVEVIDRDTVCPEPHHANLDAHTHVHLVWATPEHVKEAMIQIGLVQP
jgi:hypothetical protein